MAVFGAPVTHEDDAERAVRAGLRILEAIDDLNSADSGLELRVRIGINSGEAVVSLSARPERGEGMVTGDVVNTASRLQSAARVGEIAVGGQTFRATEAVFDYEALEPVSVKGKAEPVGIWRPRAVRARLGTDITRAYTTPFVGRELEQRLLEGSFERAVRDASVQLVTVVGEPGVGKSRLVAELLAFVDGRPELVSWRQGRCLPYGDGITFWALGEIVKAEAGILESDSPEQAAQKLDAAIPAGEPDREWLRARVGPLVGIDTEGVSTREESFTPWRRFLELLADDRPAVLVFEDLQWADEALIAFLEHLADWSEGSPLLVVCTTRPELYERQPGWAGGKRNATTINLAPLADEETARLVSPLLDTTVLPAELQTLVLERAGGNPLYAEEFVRMLQDRKLLVLVGRTLRLREEADFTFPDGIQALVAPRLDTLDPERKALLQDAAVVGKVFWEGRSQRWPGSTRGSSVMHSMISLGRSSSGRRASLRWTARPNTPSGTPCCATSATGRSRGRHAPPSTEPPPAGSSGRPASGSRTLPRSSLTITEKHLSSPARPARPAGQRRRRGDSSSSPATERSPSMSAGLRPTTRERSRSLPRAVRAAGYPCPLGRGRPTGGAVRGGGGGARRSGRRLPGTGGRARRRTVSDRARTGALAAGGTRAGSRHCSRRSPCSSPSRRARSWSMLTG